jgi:predicted GNAT family acetyltransferase
MALCELNDFLKIHENSLLANDTKYNLALGILDQGRSNPSKMKLWSFGSEEAFALQTPPHFIVLGELNESQAKNLFLLLRGQDFRGCMGPRDSATRFKAVLESFGVPMQLSMEQRIYELKTQPCKREVDGYAKEFQIEDLPLFYRWYTSFIRESLPYQVQPNMEEVLKITETKKIFFWKKDQRLVSMAARTRETPSGSNISYVFTPPEERGRGFAQAITAHACEHAFREGKKKVFLYADLSNPISNHLYERLGFLFAFASSSYQKVAKK